MLPGVPSDAGRLRRDLSQSGEAKAVLNGAYLNVLGRPEDATSLAMQQAQLAGGSLATVQLALANSAEGANLVNTEYLTILGRPVDAPSLAAKQAE